MRRCSACDRERSRIIMLDICVDCADELRSLRAENERLKGDLLVESNARAQLRINADQLRERVAALEKAAIVTKQIAMTRWLECLFCYRQAYIGEEYEVAHNPTCPMHPDTGPPVPSYAELMALLDASREHWNKKGDKGELVRAKAVCDALAACEKEKA